MNSLRTFLWLCLSLLLISCASFVTDQGRVDEGIGGTGYIVNTGLGGTGKTSKAGEGIGGTGAVALGGEGIGGTGKQLASGEGIGGTGVRANNQGTGIVGTITAFGSIWVNNAHVTFGDDTPITINLQSANQQDLKIGQVVAVLSDRNKGFFAARSIDIVHEAIGPVSSRTTNSVTVLHQTIHIEKDTLVESSGKLVAFADVNVGQWLAVSGHRRRNGEIQATRLDVIEEKDFVQVIGTPEFIEDNTYAVNGLRLQVDSWLMDEYEGGRLLITGDLVLLGDVTGYESEEGPVDAFMHVENIGSDSVSQVIEQSEFLLMEGFVSDVDSEAVINGVEFDLPDSFDEDMFDIDEPVQIGGSLEDEGFAARDFVIQTEDDESNDLLPEQELEFDEE